MVLTVTPVGIPRTRNNWESDCPLDSAPLIFRELPNYLTELIRTIRKYVPEPSRIIEPELPNNGQDNTLGCSWRGLPWRLDPDEHWRLSYRIACDGMPDVKFSIMVNSPDGRMIKLDLQN